MNENDIIGNGIVTTILIIFRPGVQEIIEFLLNYFDYVFIWSAGVKRYVRAIESVLIDPNHNMYKKERIKVLSRKDCNEITEKSVLKDLASKGYDLKRTLIIDDNKTTYINNPDNAIGISGYNPSINEEQVKFKDESLLEIKKWIIENDVKNCKDVRKLDKSKIFKSVQHKN